MQKATFESKRLTFVQFCSIMEHKRKAIFTMEKKALNRSVRKTRRKLQTSLTQLMQQKPFQEISVRELAEQADINRGTFYLHYHDVNEWYVPLKKNCYNRFGTSSMRIQTVPRSQNSACMPF